MNGRRSGTRNKSRKKALDSAWSMEMSRLTRDGTAEPVSRDQILRRERGQGIFHFPCSASWPLAGLVTLPSCDGYTYSLCIYLYSSSEPCTNECTCTQIKKYTGTWNTNQYKKQYCTSTYIWQRAGLATLRGWSILLCYKEVVAILTSSIHKYRSSAIIVPVCCTNKQSWTSGVCEAY